MLAPRKTLWSTPDAVIDRVIEMVGPLSSADRIVDLGCGDGKVLLRWAEIYSSNLQDVSHNNDACESESSGVERRSVPGRSSGIDVESSPASTINCISSKILKQSQHPTFVGIDIDPDRILKARASWDNGVHLTRSLLSDIPFEFHVANAVINDEAWNRKSTTILYVYLTPRGMKQLKRQILEKEVNLFHETPCSSTDSNDDDPCMHEHSMDRRSQRRIIISYMNPLPETKLLRKDHVSLPELPDTAFPIYIYEW